MTKLGLFSRDIFKDFDKVFIGFDDQFNRLAKIHDDLTKSIPNYPPFNVKKIDDNHYTIEMAVAGFGQSDIDIEIDGGKLVVKGNNAKADTEEVGEYITRGIATRTFTRAWDIGDTFKVDNAEMFNGILTIALERVIPEHKKPVKVAVKTKGEREFLKEGE